jgi:hypothetical protein
MTKHLSLLAALLLPLFATALPAQQAPASQPSLEYKMISNFKQPFNDDLKIQISKGWKPVGGVGVTVWNGDLYFAQLLSRPAGQGQ